MNDHNNISDNEIYNLLKQRLLKGEDEDMLKAESHFVFSAEPHIVPSIKKEKELEKLTNSKNKPILKKWGVIGTSVIIVLSALFYYNNYNTNSPAAPSKVKNNTAKHGHEIIPHTKPEIKDGDTAKTSSLKHLSKGIYRGQVVEKILKENADCSSPILITDTIVFSPHTPKGNGNEMEFFDNKPDDLMYFENEHNTVWYKFIVPETGQLTFDIIPVDKNDDYDFMLYRWSGADFRTKAISKITKPIRTCISRNDKKIKSMTGLALDASLETHVHSGEGTSYVKYMNVIKGETYYLLLDNVYNNGNGHTIHFHYKPIKPGELYVGQKTVLERLTFKDSDDVFLPGSGYEKTLDSLYKFLVDNPKLKIEIQGHVNATKLHQPEKKKPGQPVYTAQKLSELRALAIYKFLTKKGIPNERLQYTGYGSTRKKIQNPRTSEECYKNIRAEIEIMSLDYQKDLELMKKKKK